jgi:hypothetical protein
MDLQRLSLFCGVQAYKGQWEVLSVDPSGGCVSKRYACEILVVMLSVMQVTLVME